MHIYRHVSHTSVALMATHDILSVTLMATHNDTTALFCQSAVLAVDPPARGLVRVHRITHRLSLQDCVLTTVQD